MSRRKRLGTESQEVCTRQRSLNVAACEAFLFLLLRHNNKVYYGIKDGKVLQDTSESKGEASCLSSQVQQETVTSQETLGANQAQQGARQKVRQGFKGRQGRIAYKPRNCLQKVICQQRLKIRHGWRHTRQRWQT